MKKIQWIEARGTCGFNLGEAKVEAAYVNGVALFVFEGYLSSPDRPEFNCVVTGHMTCGATSLEEAKSKGEDMALRYGVAESGRRMTRKQFNEVVASPERLPEVEFGHRAKR